MTFGITQSCLKLLADAICPATVKSREGFRVWNWLRNLRKDQFAVLGFHLDDIAVLVGGFQERHGQGVG